jgi:predicted HTH transcriptional regulator
MDYLDMSHLVGDERYHDRLTYDGLWENNLYQFFRIVSPKVQFDLPRPFKLEKGGKRNDDTPQHEAVREAFTNAIIHCDLMADAGVLRIEKHDDRLCFRNPGLLKLPVEAIYRGGNSKARNPKIQNMLRMIGFGENVGSGFPKIIAAWKETNWGEPQLLNKLDVDEVELVLPVPSTKATSDTAPANAPANAPVNAPVKLNKTQSAIVKAMRNDNHITYEDLGTIVEVDRSTIRRNIAVLKEKGVIRRVGEDKNGYWEVCISV